MGKENTNHEFARGDTNKLVDEIRRFRSGGSAPADILRSMDRRNSRRNGLLVGITCTVASAFVFASILMHRSNPQPPSAWHSYHPGSELMPTWMAIGVGGLFGLVGLGSLIPAAFNLQLPQPFGNAIAMLIMTCFLGFFDVVCIRSVVIGDQFASLPFVPNSVNTVLNWAIWGVFILFFSSFTIACFMKVLTPPQRSG